MASHAAESPAVDRRSEKGCEAAPEEEPGLRLEGELMIEKFEDRCAAVIVWSFAVVMVVVTGVIGYFLLSP